MNKKFLSTTFTLSGTMIGAGILGLPYIFSKAGFLVGLYWLVALSGVILFVNLSLAEITLRTKEKHQLSGYAKKYLGPWAGKLMLLGLMFGIYSSLIAYLVGEGRSLSQLFPGSINPIILGILFWLSMTFLLRDGLRNLKKIEMYGVTAIVIIVIGIFVIFFPSINPENLNTIEKSEFLSPIGVILFALLGFSSIPELRTEIKGQEKNFKKAIILGTLIPVVLYILFTLTFVGILGTEVTEVATLSFGGPIMTLLGIFTMLTSFFVLSLSLKDSFKFDVKTSPKINFLLTSLLPLILYLIISYFDLLNFTTILGIGGVVSAGTTGVLILIINSKAKQKTKRSKPEITMPSNWILTILISVIFIAGMLIQFLN